MQSFSHQEAEALITSTSRDQWHTLPWDFDPGDTKAALDKWRAKKKRPSDVLGEGQPNPEVLVLAPFREDRSPANGSSIVVLAEFEGRSCLLGADALPSVLQQSVGRLLAERRLPKLDVDAYKLAHHGGKHNTSVDLLQQLRCQRYLFSTNGRPLQPSRS
jgi:hypothetical protein